MREMGVRALRAHLSQVLASVRGGEVVVVTQNGEPIARIAPHQAGASPEMRRLLESGLATWGGVPLEPLEPIEVLAASPGPTVSEILAAQRSRDRAVPGQ